MITRDQLIEAIVEAVLWDKAGPIIVKGDWDVRDTLMKTKKYTKPSYQKLKRQMRLSAKDKKLLKYSIRMARKVRG